MDRENGSGNKIILTIVSAVTFLVAMIGATFAYFSATSGPVKSGDITTAKLDLEIKNIQGTNITNIKPTTWTDSEDNTLTENLANKDIAQVSFTVSSTTQTVNSTYDLNMSASEGLKLTEDAVTCTTTEDCGKISDVKYKLYKKTGENYTPVENTGSGNFSDENATENHEIIKGETITTGSYSQDYVLFIYIEDNQKEQNKLQNITFNVSISGAAKQATAG